jgi:hypothetical protein
MAKITQKQIIEDQTKAINILSNRLIEIEVLLASFLDLAAEKNLFNKSELEVMINQKVQILNSRADMIKNKLEDDKLESFPYFGQPGEA